MLRMNNQEEYSNPLLYDLENNRVPEFPFIREWAEFKQGPILDLACGTGRITIPLAEQGFKVTGVDINEGMLTRAKEKAKEKGVSINFIHQDCAQLDLDETFPLVLLAGCAFQHFLTNESQEQLLRSVANALTSDGIFIFDSRFPCAKELLSPSTLSYKKTLRDNEGREYDIFHQEEYNTLTQVQHHKVVRRYKDTDGQVEEHISHIDLRYTYPQEMVRLLRLTGLEAINVFSGWNNNAIQPQSEWMVYVCRKVQ